MLLTDGESNVHDIDEDTAIDDAVKAGVKVYTIGAGTTGVAPIRIDRGDGTSELMQTQVSIDEALLRKIADRTHGQYFRATDNAAFLAKQDAAVAAVKRGDYLTVALAATALFPEDFRHILAVAEEAGRLNEVLRQQAEHYHEESDRRLRALTKAMVVGVSVLVGGLVVFCIFRIFSTYVDMLNQF